MRIQGFGDTVSKLYAGWLIVPAQDGEGYDLVSPRDNLFAVFSLSAVGFIDEDGVAVSHGLEDEEDDEDPNDGQAPNVIVADIDGCCIFSEHRIPFLLDGDVDSYHRNHVYDRAIDQGVVVYRKFLNDPAYRMFFVTARSENARAYTLSQLRGFVSPDIRDDQLLMRPKDEHPSAKEHDAVLKPRLLREKGILPHHIFLVFEDSSSVVKMWRTLGVVCYQTAFSPDF